MNGGNVLKNSWWIFGLKPFNCAHQLQEEASSAGEQLVSNKVDAITIRKRDCSFSLFFNLSDSFNG